VRSYKLAKKYLAIKLYPAILVAELLVNCNIITEFIMHWEGQRKNFFRGGNKQCLGLYEKDISKFMIYI
jgi:hypothetical protein